MRRFSALLLLVAALGGCALDDDPAVTAAMREDRRCRGLGAVPQTQLYLDCRRALFIDRDAAFQAKLRAEQEARAAKAAKRAEKAAAKAAAKP